MVFLFVLGDYALLLREKKFKVSTLSQTSQCKIEIISTGLNEHYNMLLWRGKDVLSRTSTYLPDDGG